MKFYLIAALFLLSCSSNHNSLGYDTLITQVTDGDTICLYLKNNRLIAGTTRNDSSVYTYFDTSSVAHKMIIYSKQSKSIINQCTNSRDEQEGYDVLVCSNGERFLLESEHAEQVPFHNKYLLLSDDYYYITAILSDTVFSNFTKGADYGYSRELNIGVGQLQGSLYSPFLQGTIIKKMSFIIIKGFLKKITATFYDEINKQNIDYERHYQYNDDSTIRSITTKNLSANEIESLISYSYTRH